MSEHETIDVKVPDQDASVTTMPETVAAVEATDTTTPTEATTQAGGSVAAAGTALPTPNESKPAGAGEVPNDVVPEKQTEPEALEAESAANTTDDACQEVVPAGLGRRAQFYLTGDMPVCDRSLEFIDLMKDSHRVFRAEPGGTAPSKRILLLTGKPPNLRLSLAAPSELRHYLANYIDVYSDKPKGYTSIPLEEMLGILHSEHLSSLPAIARVANGVAFNGEHSQLSGGYNPSSKTYVLRKVQPDASAVGTFRKLCGGLNFKDEASFINVLGYLVIALLGPAIVRAPGLMIMGDLLVGTTAGKTTLALMLKVIIDAVSAPRIYTFPHDEKEYMKLLGGILSEPNERVVVFDNAKPNHGDSYLENQTFEQQIGSRVLSVRVLGTNHQMARTNDLLFVCTANGLSMAIDFANRFIHSHLEVPEGGVRQEPMIDKVKEAEEQREKVLAEVAYMIQNWKAKGAPLSAKAHHRDQAMASLVGGILEANGYDGFLANHSSALAAATGPLIETYYTLASLSMAKKGGTFTALEWINHVRDNKVLKRHFPAKDSEHRLRPRANRFLQQISRTPVVLDGVRYTLNWVEDKRSHRYFLTEEALPGHDSE
ncbi:MAG: hypothetical protein DPW14_12100 [Planctomycetes bacterium]|nr:hypothetical protein [Planctomycetota bacterium]